MAELYRSTLVTIRAMEFPLLSTGSMLRRACSLSERVMNLIVSITERQSTISTRSTQCVGAIDLTGLNLVLSGSFTPVAGDVFSIVSNDGTDPINGTF